MGAIEDLRRATGARIEAEYDRYKNVWNISAEKYYAILPDFTAVPEEPLSSVVTFEQIPVKIHVNVYQRLMLDDFDTIAAAINRMMDFQYRAALRNRST